MFFFSTEVSDLARARVMKLSIAVEAVGEAAMFGEVDCTKELPDVWHWETLEVSTTEEYGKPSIPWNGDSGKPSMLLNVVQSTEERSELEYTDDCDNVELQGRELAWETGGGIAEEWE